MALPDLEAVLGWRGRDVVDRDGQKVGKVRDLFLDSESDRPEWAGVSTGFLGRRIALVPLADAAEAEGTIRVPFTEQQIEEAPTAEPDVELSQSEEAALYRHYGLEYSHRESATDLPPGDREDEGAQTERRPADAADEESVAGEARASEDVSSGDAVGRGGGEDVGATPGGRSGPDDTPTDRGDEPEAVMTRSEEEPIVGTEVRPRERVRLKRYVVEDQVERTVPVQREEIRVDYDPPE